MVITEESLLQQKKNLEAERDRLLAELNVRIGALQTVDSMLSVLRTPNPGSEMPDQATTEPLLS